MVDDKNVVLSIQNNATTDIAGIGTMTVLEGLDHLNFVQESQFYSQFSLTFYCFPYLLPCYSHALELLTTRGAA